MRYSGLVAKVGMAVLLCLGLSAPLAAKPTVLRCEVDAGAAQGGLVTKLYFFSYEPGASEGQVIDGLIKHENGDMINMTVSGDNAKRSDFKWKFRAKDSVGSVFPVVFSATYFKADKSFVVSGKVTGGDYIGSADARGKCKEQ